MLKKKNKGKEYFPFQIPILLLLSLGLTFPAFSFLGGFEALFFGTLLGAAVISLSLALHFMIKSKLGRSLFPFQSILLALTSLGMVVFGLQVFG